MYNLFYSLRKTPFHATHVFLLHLSSSDLQFQFAGFFGSAPEQKKTRCQSIQSVNCSQVFQVVLLGQNENHGIMSISPTRMYLKFDLIKYNFLYL